MRRGCNRALGAAFLALWLGACADEPAPPGPPPGELELTSGQEAMRAGQYVVAEDLFQRAFSRGADAATSLLWQARARLALGLVDGALELLTRLSDLYPTHAEGRVLRVRLALMIGDHEQAFEQLRLLERHAPGTAEGALLEVELYLALGLPSRAERAIVAGRARFPDLPEWAFHAAKADLLRAWVSAARGAYAQAATTLPHGLGHARNAWFAGVLGETDRAERAWLDAVASAAGQGAPLSLSSDFYAHQGRFDDAVADLRALEGVLGHGSPDLARRVAALLVRVGRHADAQAVLKPYLQRRMNDFTAQRELVTSYLAEGKSTEASATLEVLVSKDRNSAATHYLTGLSRLLAGDSTGARTAFQESRTLGAGHLPIDLALAAVALLTRDWFDAEFQARKSLEQTPHDTLAVTVWAASRKYQAQVPAAQVLLDRLAVLEPAAATRARALLSLPTPAPGAPVESRDLNLPSELLDRVIAPAPVPATLSP
jgi:tetratricopeptide (TPR) repeat protein